TDLFEEGSVRRLCRHFEKLLEIMVANPQEGIRARSLLTEIEERQVLIEWNDTAVGFAQRQCVHQLFAEQVERAPEDIAVTFGSEQLSYGELNRRGNQLAHYLQALGVSAESVVGICVERS